MFLGVFRFAKKMELFIKGGIRCISGVLLVELTGHDNSTADIMVLMY